MRNKKVIIASSITAVLLLLVSVAFAALSSSLNISFGSVTQNALSWNVGFKGSSVTPTQEGTSNTGLNCGTASVTPSTVTIADLTLSKPGDKCTYPLVIENKGDIAATLSSISATAPTDVSCNISGSTMVCGNITYEIQTTAGVALTTGITLNSKESYNIRLIVSYTGEELTSAEVTQINSKFTLTYVQADKRTGVTPDGVDSPNYVCKRATTLHTQICDRTSSGCIFNGYSNGDTITYGNLGTGGNLSSGDAFDCDVNGDGIFDPETERFYYLSGVDGNDSSEYAALIYYAYTNEDKIITDTSSMDLYDDNDRLSNNGPRNAIKYLPTVTQWKNVSLSNNGTRQIYAENGTTVSLAGNLPLYTYTSRAARLPDYREINKACGITISYYVSGELNSCDYLLENTDYSYDSDNSFYWLESPYSEADDCIWMIHGEERFVGRVGVLDQAAVRPVIEVKKSDIDY